MRIRVKVRVLSRFTGQGPGNREGENCKFQIYYITSSKVLGTYGFEKESKICERICKSGCLAS